jgi:molecular chaperone DnaK
VSADDKAKVSGLTQSLKDAIAAEDYDKMQSFTTELQQALYSISANLYQAAGAGTEGAASGAAGDTTGTTSGGEDVIDAEFTEPGEN